jgi:hypothetical protein
LAVKRNKCSFRESTIAYLGHVISEQGVTMDAEKVATVQSWPQPRTVRAVRGFHGLTGYYRKFIHSYWEIAGPLTMLLKWEAFRWSPEAATVLTSEPVLKLPDFAQPFVVDCDASGSSIDAVLHQG